MQRKNTLTRDKNTRIQLSSSDGILDNQKGMDTKHCKKELRALLIEAIPYLLQNAHSVFVTDPLFFDQLMMLFTAKNNNDESIYKNRIYNFNILLKNFNYYFGNPVRKNPKIAHRYRMKIIEYIEINFLPDVLLAVNNDRQLNKEDEKEKNRIVKSSSSFSASSWTNLFKRITSKNTTNNVGEVLTKLISEVNRMSLWSQQKIKIVTLVMQSVFKSKYYQALEKGDIVWDSADNQLQIKLISSANNKVYLADLNPSKTATQSSNSSRSEEHDIESETVLPEIESHQIIIHVCEAQPECLLALSQLNHAKHYLPETYYQVCIPKPPDQLMPDAPVAVTLIRAMEKLSDLRHYSMKLANTPNDHHKLYQLITIAAGMIQCVLDLTKDKIFFVDMKLSNFFIREDCRVFIPDIKSLFPYELNFRASEKDLVKPAYPFQSTPEYLPPEIRKNPWKDQQYYLEHYVSYCIGVNIYMLFTGENPAKHLSFEQRFTDTPLIFNFENTIFKSEFGATLAMIIQNLVTSPAKNRIPIETACHFFGDALENFSIQPTTKLAPSSIIFEPELSMPVSRNSLI